MKTTAKRLSLVLVLVMMLQVFAMVPAFAAGTKVANSVEDAADALVTVTTWFKLQDGTDVPLTTETGFFLDNNYILTCHHGVVFDAAEVEYFAEDLGLGDYFRNNYNSRTSIRVYYAASSYKTARMTDVFSETSDFAVIKLDSSLNDITTLKLGEDKMSVPGKKIYALGYTSDGEVDSIDTSATYRKPDAPLVLESVVAKNQQFENEPHIIHKAEIVHGMSGGPTMLQDGTVIGLNRVKWSGFEEGYYGSLAIDSIREILDRNSIPYATSGSSSVIPDDEPVETEPVVTEPVETEPVIEDEICEDHEWSKWEEDGDEKVRVCEICGEEETREIKKDDAEEEADEGFDLMLIIIIAVAAVIVIVVIVIIVVVAGGKKKPANIPPAGMPPHMMNPNGNPMGGAPMGAPMGAPRPPVPPVNPVAPAPAPAPRFDDGAGNTTVLNEGAGETTVLGGGAAASAGALIRVKTGERIAITGPEFVIGKEKRRVNYCISDNNSISRAHAKIVVRGNSCYAVDMNSTNFTYVNGAKLNGGQEQLLNNGDKIKLSDEEFEFKA